MKEQIHNIKNSINESATEIGKYLGEILSIFFAGTFVPVYIFLFLLMIYVVGLIKLLEISDLLCQIYGAGFPAILISEVLPVGANVP